MTEPTQPRVAWGPPTADPGPAPGVEWAGYGARLIAYIIDGFVMGVVLVVAVLLFGTVAFVGNFGAQDPSAAGATAGLGALAVLLVIFLLVILYFPFFWASGGQTPGMRLFGIRVVRDRDGGPVGWGSAIVRLIGFWVSGAVFYLGFIWVFIDARRRGWHDLIAGTVVVRDPKR